MRRVFWACVGAGIGIITVISIVLPQSQDHDDEACARYGDIARNDVPQFTRDLRRVEAGLKDIERRILAERASRTRRVAAKS